MPNVYADIDWATQGAAIDTVDALLGATIGRERPRSLTAFERRFEQVQAFDVDQTGFTALMMYFLHRVGVLVEPRLVIGCGVHAGLAFSMLAAGADEGGRLVQAVGVDENDRCTVESTKNAAHLGIGARLRFETTPPCDFIAGVEMPIDVLMIDVLDAVHGKRDYTRLARLAEPKMAPGGILLAHDACVPHWQRDIKDLTAYLVDSRQFLGPWCLPIDNTGMLLAVHQ